MSTFPSQFQVQRVQTIKDHKSGAGISKVEFSPNGRILASSSADSYIHLYSPSPPLPTMSTNRFAKRSTLSGHAKGVSDFVWSSDSRYICSCSDNQLIIMWDVEKSKPIQLFPNPTPTDMKTINSHHQQQQHHPQHNNVAQSALYLYDIFIENQITSSLHSSSSPNHNSNQDTSSNMKQECKDHITSTHQSSINNNNNSNSSNSSNESNNINTTHTHYILCLALNQQGNIMASGSFDETVILWDVRSAKHIQILYAHSDPVCCLSFCNDGTMLLSGGYDGLIRGWDMSSRRCMKTLGFDPTAISFAKWSPNGQYIISGTLDNTIRIWDFQTAKTLKTFKGHKNQKYCLFSDFAKIRNMDCIVCGSEDGFVYFWDIKTKRIVHKFKAHDDVVMATNFRYNHNSLNANNASLFASGGLQNDSVVRLWQIV